MSNPMDYEVARLKTMRRLNIPDDGRLRPEQAAMPEILTGYNGVRVKDTSEIVFDTLADCALWLDGITELENQRDRITFFCPRTVTPYGETIITVKDLAP